MSIIEVISLAWGWAGIQPVEVVGENDFGNLIVKDVAGMYWRICPEDVYCEVIANSREELDALSTNQEFLADWYMQALVEQAEEKLGPLSEGRKYHFVIPGVLGGEYGASNFQTVSLVEQIRFSGDLGKQIKELPDGAQVKLKVIE
ncbi:MAG: DUF1851 domain-containing protein [Candidatus Thiodiazotropha endolucinida]|nr:DUF1851 domain-containing protein [Candidatus Thiodiazotropha endolucinida]